MTEMNDSIISARGLSKRYQLGVIGRHTLQDEVRYWLYKIRGRDPRTYMSKLKASSSATEKRRIEAEEAGQGEFWALRDVSFDIARGEVVGIIGRNGAGKSTLLKILSRVTEPTTGEADINGRVASLLEVGTGFHPELTGRENIYLNGTILGMKKREIDREFDNILSFSDLDRFIDTPVKRYSSGMYVRLAFAVAAHLEPEILLVDEVLAVGDVAFQQKCLGKMKDMTSGGRTVLFVSHNMGAIRSLTNRCLLIDKGGVAFDGESGEAVDLYLEESRTGSQNGYVKVTEKHRECIKKDLAKQFLFHSVELRDGNGKRASVFEEFAPFEIAVTFESVIACNRLELLFAIKTVEEMVVANLISGVMDVELVPGHYSISCHVPRPNIAKGHYSVTVYLLTGNRNPQDLLLNILQFEVILNKSMAYTAREANFSYGDVIRLDKSWSTVERVEHSHD